MADLLKCQNPLINTIMFPGGMVKSSYSQDSFNDAPNLKLLYVPFQRQCSYFSYWNAAPSSIPCLLAVNNNNKTNTFCIHFHGNACDIGQIMICAQREAQAFKSHYLLVEYPGYGISDGYPNETVIDEVSDSVIDFVVDTLHVPVEQIVLIGRSIGTGPACRLAANLEARKRRVKAVVLQSPFSSIRDTTADLLGVASWFMFNRWESWKYLIATEGGNGGTGGGEDSVNSSISSSSTPHSGGRSGKDSHVIRSPVLFIHADNDKIISINHSMLMHQHRLKSGLISELFIQKSNSRYIKGHNFFDYEKDVVMPTREFLLKYAQGSDSTGSSSPQPQHGSGSTSSQSAATRVTVQPLILATEVLQRYQAVPPKYQAKFEAEQRWLAKNPQLQQLAEADPSQQQKMTKWNFEVYLGWFCCPCFFCCEANLACCVHSAQYCMAVCFNCKPVFDYATLKPKSEEPPSSFFSLFNRHKEIPVEEIIDNRKTEVENPLVTGTEAKKRQRPTNHSSGSSSSTQSRSSAASAASSNSATPSSGSQQDEEIEPMTKEQGADYIYIPG